MLKIKLILADDGLLTSRLKRERHFCSCKASEQGVGKLINKLIFNCLCRRGLKAKNLGISFVIA